MAELIIYRDQYVDSTVISNRFIDEYMKDANDAQLKVYLFLIRMLSANRPTSISDIADRFNHTEKDILRSLKYWEKMHLLSLEFDSEKNLRAIHLIDSHNPAATAHTNIESSVVTSMTAMTDTPAMTSMTAMANAPAMTSMTNASTLTSMTNAPTMTSMTNSPAMTSMTNAPTMASMTNAPIMASMTNATAMASMTAATAMTSMPSMTAAIAHSIDDPSVVPAVTTVPSCFQKPIYSLDQLGKFKNQQDMQQLMFIAESYVGRPLTQAEMKCILYFKDVLKFSDDLVDYLIQYCIDQGKKDFRYIEKVALNWAQSAITTPKQAREFSLRYDRNVYEIMNALGKDNSPTLKEMEYINRWTKEYAFAPELIKEACERTVLATDKHRFEYAEQILSSWKKENVKNKADVTRMDDLYRQKARVSQNKVTSSNKFNQFTQRTYDFDQLEKEILSN
ncbi:MAG: DnaD domain protein [Lachnospiraceae bacterium]|jgi:DnaD/phage-associated family protein|nr:DnaD domain protein [Lachnospiraceae bacterium]